MIPFDFVSESPCAKRPTACAVGLEGEKPHVVSIIGLGILTVMARRPFPYYPFAIIIAAASTKHS